MKLSLADLDLDMAAGCSSDCGTYHGEWIGGEHPPVQLQEAGVVIEVLTHFLLAELHGIGASSEVRHSPCEWVVELELSRR